MTRAPEDAMKYEVGEVAPPVAFRVSDLQPTTPWPWFRTKGEPRPAWLTESARPADFLHLLFRALDLAKKIGLLDSWNHEPAEHLTLRRTRYSNAITTDRQEVLVCLSRWIAESPENDSDDWCRLLDVMSRLAEMVPWWEVR